MYNVMFKWKYLQSEDVNIFAWPLWFGKQQIEKIDAALHFDKV